ncbi:MAG TPA: GDSL-type esterase/lipase family protein [Acidimicrobiales bacterium]|nr:GDSL-type esterase/lipase family protein [Acidimicrobiales bacterium]
MAATDSTRGVDRTGLIALAVFVVAIFALRADADDEPASDGPEHVDLAMVGDSFAQQSLEQLRALAEDQDMTADLYAFGGSALCAWDAQLRDLAAREPERLVLSFAGNDLQPCINPTGEIRSPEVVAAGYAEDLSGVIDMFRAAGTDLYVVEPPIIGDPGFEANAAAMREMYRDAGLVHPGLEVIDPSDELTPDGAFHATLPCEAGEPCGPDGTVVVRQEDRIHLTPPGGRRYAEAIMSAIAEHDALDR